MSQIPHPLTGSSLSNWITLIRINQRIDPQFFGKACSISFLSTLGTPYRLLERSRFGQQIKQTSIDQPPIFIIGHWRSGTTHLHNLLSQDPQFGYISQRQAWLPEQYLGNYRISNWLLKRSLPKTRPMDRISLTVERPEEEEQALANLCPHSFYHGWSFPQQMRYYFDRYVLLNEQPETVRYQWMRVYHQLLKTTTLKTNGKRLILKNPANTARIPILLELFPQAKFIHIYRNPVDIYVSTQHLYQKMLPIYALQTFDWQEINQNIVLFYEKLLKQLLQDQPRIPPGHFVEVRYEDLETNPIHEVQRIYQTLDLPGFSTAIEPITAYLDTQKTYSKNTYIITPESVKMIYPAWKFAFQQWNYPLPSPTVGLSFQH